MQFFGSRHFGDDDIAEIGQARHQRDRFVLTNVPGERFLVARIEVECRNRIQVVGRGDRLGDAWLGVRQLDPVAAAFGKQAGYEGTDFAGAKYENLFHEIS